MPFSDQRNQSPSLGQGQDTQKMGLEYLTAQERKDTLKKQNRANTHTMTGAHQRDTGASE